MAPLPKRRHSTKRSGSRRSADTLSNVQLAVCAQCNSPKKSHSVCPTCGYYKDKQVIQVRENSKS